MEVENDNIGTTRNNVGAASIVGKHRSYKIKNNPSYQKAEH